ncbi:MAG: hypothetical protein Q4A25_00735 [Candidatus Saccharibacteria bacterium]|nr:hypothetical protein [Candidatus Saccharibacteria bacterium]
MSRLKSKKGDTLIEVVLSFVMFSLVATISLAVMHAGISGAEASIELTLARVEIDAQSEAMRFIQESYSNDRAYPNLWRAITNTALNEDYGKIPELSRNNCSKLYDDFSVDPTIVDFNAFVLNSRQINDGVDPVRDDYYGNTFISTKEPGQTDKFSESSLSPRIIYTTKSSVSEDEETTDDNLMSDESYIYIYRAEGIYDFLVKDTKESEPNKKLSHYDFYVYTCWLPPGAEHPTTIGTVTRLYNPEYLNAQ